MLKVTVKLMFIASFIAYGFGCTAYAQQADYMELQALANAVKPGWNLLGSSMEFSAAELTQQLTSNGKDVSSIWKWNNNNWQVLLPKQDTQGYATNKGFDVLSALNAHEGFWINWGVQGKSGTGTWTLWDENKAAIVNAGMIEFYTFAQDQEYKGIVTIKDMWGPGYDVTYYFVSSDSYHFTPNPTNYGDNPPDMSFTVSVNTNNVVTGEIVMLNYASGHGHRINVNFMYDILTFDGKFE